MPTVQYTNDNSIDLGIHHTTKTNKKSTQPKQEKQFGSWILDLGSLIPGPYGVVCIQFLEIVGLVVWPAGQCGRLDVGNSHTMCFVLCINVGMIQLNALNGVIKVTVECSKIEKKQRNKKNYQDREKKLLICGERSSELLPIRFLRFCTISTFVSINLIDDLE